MATTENTYEMSDTSGNPPPPVRRRRIWPRVLIVAVLVLVSIAAIAWFANRTAINGYANTGAAYAARVGCSCVYIGGRDIGDCAKDKVAGMELVRLSQDAASKSVTATFPVVASQTATYREGYGCLLEPWEK